MSRSPASLSGLFFNTDPTKSTEVTLTNISALQGLSAVTIECWVYLTNYPNSSPGNAKAFNFFNGGTQTGYQIQVNSAGTLTSQVGNSSVNTSGTSTPVIPLNAWTHIATSWNGTSVFGFINGVNVTTNGLSGGTTGNPALTPAIGNQAASGRAFPGTISELRISNTARYTANFTPQTTPFTPDANTVGLYHMWEGTGTTVNDNSSQQNNGTLSGTPLPTWSNGYFLAGPTSRTTASNRTSVQNFPASLNFNGTSTGLTSPITPDITGFSFGLWVKPYTKGAQNMIACWRTNNTTDGFRLYTIDTGSASNDGKILITVTNGTTNNNTNFIRPNLSTWIHLAMTYDGSLGKLYLNGVLQGTTVSTVMTAATGQTLTFGKDNYGSSDFLPCNLSNIVWQNTVTWTDRQILALYQNGATPSGATFVLPLTEGTGTTAYDTSGNGNNGTITSGTYTNDVPSKARGIVGGNLVYNGNFEYAPPSGANVATTTGSRWIDGTASGSVTNSLFAASFTQDSGTGGSAIFDSTVFHSGTYSVKLIETDATSRARVNFGATGTGATINTNTTNLFNPIILSPSTSYTLTAWMKTSSVTGSGIRMDTNEYGGSNGSTNTRVASTTGAVTLLGTNDWTQLTTTFTTASSSAILVVLFVMPGNATGTIWIDDIVLTPTVNTTRNLV